MQNKKSLIPQFAEVLRIISPLFYNPSLSAKKCIFYIKGQVFWLPDHTNLQTFPPSKWQWHKSDFVPGNSGGPAFELNELPY